jgi:hypothetical protein
MKHYFFLVCLSLAAALPAEADTPPGRYTVNAGTVKDNRTGLTWQQSADTASYGADQAAVYCLLTTFAGGGWRLPSYSELMTLVDLTRYNPAIDPTAFPATSTGFFWTRSKTLGSYPSGYFWYVEFGDGASYVADGTNSYHVRCVR